MDAKTKSKPPTSDAAVIEATGRSWADWVKLLDAVGGRTLDHRAIQHALRSHGDVHAGSAQMATVGHEGVTARCAVDQTEKG